MKKLLFLSIMFFSFSLSAQIIEVQKPKFEKIGEVNSGGIVFLSSIQFSKGIPNDSTNTYIWTYRNSKFTTITDIQSISFSANTKEFDLFYNMLKTQISSPKGTEKQLLLGKNDILIKTIRNLGVSSLTIFNLTNNSYFYLTNNQIDKLFGKN